MGKRGPRPQPTEILQMRGTHRTDRHGDPAQQPQYDDAGNAPEPPEWLGERGRSVWVELAPKLASQNCLTSADLPAFACYCEAWDEFHAAKTELEKPGASMVSTSQKGGDYQHPAVGIKNRAIDRIKAFSREFGLTPSARVGLDVKPQQQKKGPSARKRNA